MKKGIFLDEGNLGMSVFGLIAAKIYYELIAEQNDECKLDDISCDINEWL
jgi:hypothetical protein